MTIIVNDPLEATSMLCTTSSIYDTVDDPDLASTTVSSLASTISSQMSSPVAIRLDYTNRYLDSLSTEQLCQMEQLLEQKEDEIIVNTLQQEKPKVYEKKI